MTIPGVRHPQQGEIAKGDWIWIVSRYGASGEQIKRAKARIVDVMRKAVIVDNIEGRKPGTQTIHFNELELMPPELQPDSSPTRRKWEKNKTKNIVEPISPPTLTSSPFAGKFGDPSIAEVTSLLSQKPTVTASPPVASPQPSPPARPRSTPPPKPAPKKPANGVSLTHDADEWAEQGKSVLKKKMQALEARLREAREEIEARRILVEGIEKELAKSREMLSLLDS